jgi:hypothetical protein
MVRVNPVFVVLLACLWLYFAYSSYQRGNTSLAILFLVIGAALTFYRLRRRPPA